MATKTIIDWQPKISGETRNSAKKYISKLQSTWLSKFYILSIYIPNGSGFNQFPVFKVSATSALGKKNIPGKTFFYWEKFDFVSIWKVVSDHTRFKFKMGFNLCEQLLPAAFCAPFLVLSWMSDLLNILNAWLIMDLRTRNQNQELV